MSFPPPFDLTGRTALVTGSSRGIGRALALGLARAGADIVVHCATRLADAEAVARDIGALGRRAVTIRADLGDSDQCRTLVAEAVAALGRIDILALNGSMEIRGKWQSVPEADFDRQVAVNLRSTLILTQSAVPAMVERKWGRVLAIGSIQEAKPNPNLLVYAALKAAQTNMMLNLARHHAADGVTFNTLSPGAIATERNAEVLSVPDYADRVTSQIPARRIGDAEDCVGAALMLCSEAGSYITGSRIFVDGGWHGA